MTSRPETTLLHPMWAALRRHLEARRQPIQEQIRQYPPPIPACDAHFNHLLEQRSILSRELVRLEAASKAVRADSAVQVAVEEFIRTSACVDDDAARSLFRGSMVAADC